MTSLYYIIFFVLIDFDYYVYYVAIVIPYMCKLVYSKGHCVCCAYADLGETFCIEIVMYE